LKLFFIIFFNDLQACVSTVEAYFEIELLFETFQKNLKWLRYPAHWCNWLRIQYTEEDESPDRV